MVHIRIKELRKEKGLVQKEVADFLGVSRSTYAGYETGRSNPDFDSIIKLADLFEVSTDFILGRTDLRYTVDEKKMLDVINLSDEELMKKYDFVADGKPIDPEEIKKLLKIVRYLETQED